MNPLQFSLKKKKKSLDVSKLQMCGWFQSAFGKTKGSIYYGAFLSLNQSGDNHHSSSKEGSFPGLKVTFLLTQGLRWACSGLERSLSCLGGGGRGAAAWFAASLSAPPTPARVLQNPRREKGEPEMAL